MIFFIERHTDPSSPHYGGYHRHVLIEDASESRWHYPSSGMKGFMISIDPQETFSMMMKNVPSDQVKCKLLEKVCRDLNRSIPNGYGGSKAQIKDDDRGGVDGWVHYLTKQVDQFHPAYEVIDPTSSDIDPAPLLSLYH